MSDFSVIVQPELEGLGYVKIVLDEQTEGLPYFFDLATGEQSSYAVKGLSREQAEEWVKRLGSNPKQELFVRWAAMNCPAS